MKCQNQGLKKAAKYFPQPNVEGGKWGIIINGIFRGVTVAGPQSRLCPMLD